MYVNDRIRFCLLYKFPVSKPDMPRFPRQNFEQSCDLRRFPLRLFFLVQKLLCQHLNKSVNPVTYDSIKLNMEMGGSKTPATGLSHVFVSLACAIQPEVRNLRTPNTSFYHGHLFPTAGQGERRLRVRGWGTAWKWVMWKKAAHFGATPELRRPGRRSGSYPELTRNKMHLLT